MDRWAEGVWKEVLLTTSGSGTGCGPVPVQRGAIYFFICFFGCSLLGGHACVGERSQCALSAASESS